MKKLLLSIITMTALSFGANAQDSTAFLAGATVSESYASISTLSGSNLRITGDWTLEAWIKIVLFNGQLHIIETYSTSGNNGGFVLRLNGSKVQAYQIENQVTSTNTVLGSTAIPTGEWHHVAATLNETTDELKVYLDGVLDGTSTATINTSNINNSLKIGARGDDNNTTGQLEIDNVRIWNKAKTETEIQADTLACLTGSETDLLAWYDFEDVSSSTLVDKSTHGNNGAFINYNISKITSRIYTCIPVNSTSVTEYESEKISLYPNPANSQLTLNTTEQIESINIIDITGKTIKTVVSNNNTIDVSDLTKGIYFLQVQTDKGIMNSKFIKE